MLECLLGEAPGMLQQAGANGLHFIEGVLSGPGSAMQLPSLIFSPHWRNESLLMWGTLSGTSGNIFPFDHLKPPWVAGSLPLR